VLAAHWRLWGEEGRSDPSAGLATHWRLRELEVHLHLQAKEDHLLAKAKESSGRQASSLAVSVPEAPKKD
jgi:hypothetical protein